jgi:hypothetical protein
MMSNRWSTMPIHGFPALRLPRPDQRATLSHMPGSTVPVIRQPFEGADPVPFWAMIGSFMETNSSSDVRIPARSSTVPSPAS